MRDDDGLDNNPKISRTALSALHDQVFGWALSRCFYDRTFAEDLVQQAYVELLSGKAQFEGRASLKTFVFSVVQNLAKSRYRRQQTRLRVLRHVARDAEGCSVPAIEVDDPSQLWCAVQRLPTRQRDIIELKFCRDFTIDEAAAVMGISSGSARVHYDRAKKALRVLLDKPVLLEGRHA